MISTKFRRFNIFFYIIPPIHTKNKKFLWEAICFIQRFYFLFFLKNSRFFCFVSPYIGQKTGQNGSVFISFSRKYSFFGF